MNNNKKFYGKIASYIFSGKDLGLQFKGTPKQKKVLLEVIGASRILWKKLQDDSSSLDEIMKLIEDKKKKAKIYQKELSSKWPF